VVYVSCVMESILYTAGGRTGTQDRLSAVKQRQVPLRASPYMQRDTHCHIVGSDTQIGRVLDPLRQLSDDGTKKLRKAMSVTRGSGPQPEPEAREVPRTGLFQIDESMFLKARQQAMQGCFADAGLSLQIGEPQPLVGGAGE